MESMNIQFSAEVYLPSLIKRQILQDAHRLLEKHASWFGWSQVDLHLKYDGPQVECTLNMVTDDGRYHANVVGWDVRQIVHETINRIELQLHKHAEKRAVHVF
jgi:ribosome-associated translation inhibitor RaiA